jgi:hypothetical protein
MLLLSNPGTASKNAASAPWLRRIQVSAFWSSMLLSLSRRDRRQATHERQAETAARRNVWAPSSAPTNSVQKDPGW